jgi:hypothetical protein
MAPQQTGISVIDPISPAIDRVKLILFQPFDLAKWFVIGFCAWLAYLGQRGFNFNFRFSPFAVPDTRQICLPSFKRFSASIFP